MPDNSPFTIAGFVPPGRAYRLFSLGVTPPTPLGAGKQTKIKFIIGGLAAVTAIGASGTSACPVIVVVGT